MLPLPDYQVHSVLLILIHLHALSSPTNVATGVHSATNIAQ